ncbi:hypothetical protein CLV52_0449 [Amnibacterium kyonggiense]|uniref:Uncharacterized protein n=2 Tax=Amnibacterium kyonggiense TaxID=595671 RepID=A0A4R7FQ95_9MICO|nr:DUF6421 family protein [Amnibacterium kyonggiense]TDS79903.1 hypothetical protein CLV52_0449 [Amnibacterium kyonggiense]
MSLLESTRPAVTAETPSWLRLKAAVTGFRELQRKDGALAEGADTALAARLMTEIREHVRALAPTFPHDTAYFTALDADLGAWAAGGFDVPDFRTSLAAFNPQRDRVDGLRHLVLFPMTTQNGSPDRLLEALLVDVIWPDFIDALERESYPNALFVSLRFVDFTAGYDTDSAVLFPETVAMKELIPFTWGAIFQDREAARFRRVVAAAAEITKLELPEGAQRLLDDQELTERAFVLWDLIHDRTHMRGDLPFDPFMIKQRMPFFLYSLEELRCDLTAFREAVRLVRAAETDAVTRDHAQLAQYTILFDRIFRFPLTGSRVRNYDGLGGQLLFAWLHQHHVLHWTDTSLAIDWEQLPDTVVALSDAINELYWRSIDRPKTAHWLAAYELVRATVEPNPASRWARGLPDEVLAGAPKGYTDAVLDDEFPLSMFYEALGKKLRPTIESTAGITAATA